jgi:hypothetical protein
LRSIAIKLYGLADLVITKNYDTLKSDNFPYSGSLGCFPTLVSIFRPTGYDKDNIEDKNNEKTNVVPLGLHRAKR